jgi:hypothetical protein
MYSHGIGVKGHGNLDNKYNLVSNSTAVSTLEPFYLRNYGTSNNVIKDCIHTSNGSYGGDPRQNLTGGLWIWGGADNNIYERITINDAFYGIAFFDNQEENNYSGHDIGDNNIIRNCNFNNIGRVAYFSSSNGAPMHNNKVINCTFNKVEHLFTFNGSQDIKNLEFINSIFTEIGSGRLNSDGGSIPSAITFKYSNFYQNYNNWFPSGSGNMNVDPKFENVQNGNFKLKSDSPLIDKGLNTSNSFDDFDGSPRPQGGSHDIGSFEYGDKTVSAIKGDAGKDQTICIGNSATLTAIGGSSYKWSTGETTQSITVNPTQTTTYSVEVSDGGSSDTDEVIVTVNSAPQADAGSDVVIESGQSTTLTAIGGDSYQWSTGETTASITVSPTATTSYEVTVTKNGCESKDTVKVTVNGTTTPPSTVTADAGKDQTICEGNSATLTAAGGTSYKWSTGETTASITVSPATTTTYSVEVSDGGSSDTDEVIVIVNSAPQAKAGSNRTIERGETIVLSATGGDSYLWSTGDTTASITVEPLQTTTYSVLVSKNGCESSDQVKVNVIKSVPPADANAGDDLTICKGESIQLTGLGGDTYLWSTGQATSQITVSPERTTTYTLTATRGGVSDMDEVTVTVINCNVNNNVSDRGGNGAQNNGQTDSTIVIEEEYNSQLKSEFILKVYPNPTEGLLILESNTSLNNYNLVLMNMQGGVIYQEDLHKTKTGTSKQLDLSNLSKGIYLLQLYDNLESYVEKVMVM